jgi:hypothetical protein
VLHPIVRMYSSGQDAAAAVSALKEWGFADSMITVVAPGSHASDDAVVSALASAFVERSRARHYAEGVLKGQTAVVVRAEFGKGEAATYHLNNAGPVSQAEAFREPFVGAWDEAAPFSSIFRLRTITQFRPFGGLPTITSRGRTLGERLGFREVSASSQPTTEGFGMPMLSNSAAPFSSIFRLPVILGR